MDINYYIDRIKFQLTGGILESELKDEDYKKIIEFSLEEINRYYDETRLVQVRGSHCIKLDELEDKENISINSVTQVYRTKPNGTSSGTAGTQDPMMLSQWNLANNYYNYGTNRWVYNYLAYNISQQLSNTLSTDLDFKLDKSDRNRSLYINYNSGNTDDLVIEYIPRLTAVEEITSDFWVDILSRLSLAYAKITLGRIRTRFKQEGSLWSQDGDTLLTEGKDELKELQARLAVNSNMVYPLD